MSKTSKTTLKIRAEYYSVWNDGTGHCAGKIVRYLPIADRKTGLALIDLVEGWKILGYTLEDIRIVRAVKKVPYQLKMNDLSSGAWKDLFEDCFID